MSFQTSYRPVAIEQKESSLNWLKVSSLSLVFAMASYWLVPQLMENQIQQYILDNNPAQTITLVEEDTFPLSYNRRSPSPIIFS